MSLRDILITLIYTDYYRSSDAVILLEGDGFSRINKSCEFVSHNLANYLVFSGGIDNPSVGSFTFEKCRHIIFDTNNLPQDKLILELDSRNTREQAEQVVKICKKYNWGSIILVASHYHQFRAFMTFLKVVIEEKLENDLIIYNAPVNELNWFEDDGWGKRIDLLKNEFDKINLYQDLGHIASFEEAIKYFEWREQNIKN